MIKGSGAKPQFGDEFEMPYEGNVLKGEKLKQQLREWASYGTIEPSACDAISAVVDNHQWLDLSDKVRAVADQY